MWLGPFSNEPASTWPRELHCSECGKRVASPKAFVYESPRLPWMAKAAVAQLVEQRIRNAWVGGSSPFRGTIKLMSGPDT